MKYTEAQLTEVARKMQLDRDLDDILKAARGRNYIPGSGGWRDEVLISAATWAGHSGSMRQILNRLQSAAMNEETFTFGELEQYYQRRQSSRNVMGGARTEAALVATDIRNHRETLLDGRAYRDAKGTYFTWRAGGYFVIFGSSARIERDTPRRPLELMP